MVAVFALTAALGVAGFDAGAAAAAQSDQRGRATKDATDSIKLGVITVPIIGAGNVIGQAGIQVQLQLASPSDFDFVDKARGVLVDAFFRELYVLFDQLQGDGGKVSTAIIRQHLTRVADRVLGPGKIRDIVIIGSYQRRNLS